MSNGCVVKINCNRQSYVDLDTSRNEKFLHFLDFCLKSVLLLPRRVLMSFSPVIADGDRHLVDILGPSLAIIALCATLHLGYVNKRTTCPVNQTEPSTAAAAPYVVLIIYFVCMSGFTCLATHLTGCRIRPPTVFTMVGYSLYGYLLSITLPVFLRIILRTELDLFHLSLVFAGAADAKLIIFLLTSMQLPVARLLLCSLVGSVYMLFLIYLYYAYMHPTFVYGENT